MIASAATENQANRRAILARLSTRRPRNFLVREQNTRKRRYFGSRSMESAERAWERRGRTIPTCNCGRWQHSSAGSRICRHMYSTKRDQVASVEESLQREKVCTRIYCCHPNPPHWMFGVLRAWFFTNAGRHEALRIRNLNSAIGGTCLCAASRRQCSEPAAGKRRRFGGRGKTLRGRLPGLSRRFGRALS